MAKLKVKRSKVKLKGKVKKHTKKVSVTLPKKPYKVSTNIQDYSIHIHGEKKIGKTTLFAQEKDSFFLEFDPMQLSLSIRQRHVPDWDHFLAYIDEIEKQPDYCKTVIVDGMDIAYQCCFDWCCKKLVIDHPSDEKDYGKSWNFIRTNFESAIRRLLNLNEKGVAVRFISHSKWIEFETRSGNTTDKLMPNLTGQAEETLNGLVDIWGAYVYSGKHRVLVVKGDESTGAGHRVDSQFLTPEGEQVEEIYMGRNPKEAYANLVKAFNNEQEYINIDDDAFMPKKKKKKSSKGGLKMKGGKRKKK